jgi:hypothetical protein
VFISDNEKSILKAARTGAATWKFHDEFKRRKKIQEESSLPMDFREGFWYVTTARFYALSKYMETVPHERVIQVEADVWISENFPFSKFENLDPEVDISYPLETESTGAASILYLRDYESSKTFVDITFNLQESDKHLTDMGILGEIYLNKLMNVFVLPSSVIDSKSINTEATSAIKNDITKNLDYFGGIFDPLTYGLFIFGEDPRNNRGQLMSRKRQRSHLIYCDLLNYRVEHDILGIADSGFVQIFNLHNHSKMKNVWQKSFRSQQFKNLANSHILKPQIKRSYRITIQVIFIALLRRLKRWFK